MIAIAFCLVSVPVALQSRKRKGNLQARTRRLTSVAQRIQVSDGPFDWIAKVGGDGRTDRIG